MTMGAPGSEQGGFAAEIGTWAKDPAWLAFVRRVLDRRDRTGRFPRTITCEAEVGSALEHCLPSAAMRSTGAGKVLIDLERIERVLTAEAEDGMRPRETLETMFDRLAGRAARDLRAEAEHAAEALRAALAAGIGEGLQRVARCAPFYGIGELDLSAADHDPAHRRLAAVLNAMEEPAARLWRRLSREGGLGAVRTAAARLVAGFLIARFHQRGTVRLDHLSLSVAGDTKALRPGSSDHQRLADALLTADPDLAAQVRLAAPTSVALQRRLALERLGIVTNDAPLEVLVQGPLTIQVEGQALRDTGELARLGLPAKLTYGLLRRGRPAVPPGTRIVTVENESAFHTLAQLWPEALLVYTGGQPAWSVVLLLRQLHETDCDLAFFHAGDLDRSGLLILRSLRARSDLPVEPLWMDGESFRHCEDLALPMSPAEQERTRRLLATWQEPYGRDLLERLAASGRWIEQEALLQRMREDL